MNEIAAAMENASPTLRDNIRLLGNLLGEIILAQAGQAVFDTEETLRELAKAWRDGDQSAPESIQEVIDRMTDDPALTRDVLKAFATFFALVNLAEEHQRARVLRQRAQSAFDQDRPMDETIHEALETLKREGMSADQVQATLHSMAITLVFTAHPTESKRRSTRQILHRVSQLLRDCE